MTALSPCMHQQGMYARCDRFTDEPRVRLPQPQADPDAVQAATARQLLATSDAAALDARCGQPIAPADQKYCGALLRTLTRCRHNFGRFALRCSRTGATACSTSLAEIRGGHCSAH